MVRKYEPYLSHANCYSDWDDPDVKMEESSIGNWVKLQTYNDETARLNAEIERQRNKVRQLQQKLDETTGNFKSGKVFEIAYAFREKQSVFIAKDSYTHHYIYEHSNKQNVLNVCEARGYIMQKIKHNG